MWDDIFCLFVNDVQVSLMKGFLTSASVILHEGDIVTFGHPNGARLAAGVWKRQPDSEYQFLVCLLTLSPLLFACLFCKI